MYTAITIITPFLLMFIFITYLNKKNKGKIPFKKSGDDWSALPSNHFGTHAAFRMRMGKYMNNTDED